MLSVEQYVEQRIVRRLRYLQSTAVWEVTVTKFEWHLLKGTESGTVEFEVPTFRFIKTVWEATDALEVAKAEFETTERLLRSLLLTQLGLRLRLLGS